MIHFQEVKNLLLQVNSKWLNINKYLGLDDLKLEINLPYNTHTHTYVVFNIYFMILSRIDAVQCGRACSLFTLFEKISPLLVDHPSHTQSGCQIRSQTALLVRFSTYKSISGRIISISRREYMETAIHNSHRKFLSIIKSRVF